MQVLRFLFVNGYILLLAVNVFSLMALTTSLFWPYMLSVFVAFNALDFTLGISRPFHSLSFDRVILYFLTLAFVTTVAPLLVTSVPVLNIITLLTPLMIEACRSVLGLNVPEPAPGPDPFFVPPRRNIDRRNNFNFAPQADRLHNMLNQPADPNFVENEDNDDLRNMARLGVYGIQGHNRRQRAALDDMRERYRAEFNRRGGTAPIIEEIKQYFIREYNRNPALDANGRALPLHNVGIAAVGFDNRPYYRHTIHTAYRYLCLAPNPWLHPGMFVRAVPGGFAALTTPEELEKIAYMWLAANDNQRPLPAGQTRESILNEFTTAISELGRAYNQGPNELGPDMPTCPNGMNQRITQFYMVFLNDRPETRPLTADILSQKFRQEMVNESPLPASLYNKMRTMNRDVLNQLESALNKGIMLDDDLTAQETAALNQMIYTADEVNVYIDTCKNYFGAPRISHRHEHDVRIAFMDQRFDSFEQMIRYLAQNPVKLYCQHLLRNIEQLKNAAPEAAAAEQQAPERRRNHRHGAVRGA